MTASSILPAGAFMVGLGGLCFHMSQFHTAQLFPHNKGFISSLYVGFFIASGVTFELLRAIYVSMLPDEGPAHDTYRAILIAHAFLCLPWIALMLWMNPRHALKAGQTYHFHTSRLRFVVTDLVSHHEAHGVAGPTNCEISSSIINTASCSVVEGKWKQCEADMTDVPTSSTDVVDASQIQPLSVSHLHVPGESGLESAAPESETRLCKSAVHISGKNTSDCLHRNSFSRPGHDRIHQLRPLEDRRSIPQAACASHSKTHGYQLRQR